VKATGVVTWTDPFRPLASVRCVRGGTKLIETSGVTYRSLHMNRHTLGTNLSDAGEGIETIGEWLGHASADTTKVYVHNSRSRLRRRKAQGE
jgi:integrase